jgi:23S rRNA (cytidine1920-2'-O)/16S rRNA (cytidine1409-2'-O)-methyltransferase
MSSKNRLDQELARRGLVASRSQAESYIKLGKVKVNGAVVSKPGFLIGNSDEIVFDQSVQYVSRAGLKLASVAEKLKLDFKDKTVLDVGSSTGGFTDYALQHGAKKVIAVDVGSDQLHPSLRGDERIDLREKTDIRDVASLAVVPDIVVIDVSFISLRDILPAVAKLVGDHTQIVAMLKPQFESNARDVNKGVIKNDRIRRQILKDFEMWSRSLFVVVDKADSEVAGAKGNRERFYLLKVR